MTGRVATFHIRHHARTISCAVCKTKTSLSVWLHWRMRHDSIARLLRDISNSVCCRPFGVRPAARVTLRSTRNIWIGCCSSDMHWFWVFPLERLPSSREFKARCGPAVTSKQSPSVILPNYKPQASLRPRLRPCKRSSGRVPARGHGGTARSSRLSRASLFRATDRAWHGALKRLKLLQWRN